MRRLAVFDSVTLDGYFTGKDGDLSWAHEGSDDPEFRAFLRRYQRRALQVGKSRAAAECTVSPAPAQGVARI